MDQTKIESFVEQSANIGTGYFISFWVWDLIVVPLVMLGALTLENNHAIVGIFTVTSFIRGYSWRRFFARGFHKYINKVVRKFV